MYSTVSAFGQKETLKVAKNYYESYPEDSILSLFENENLNQILFIRHGEPNLNKKGWRNRKQAIQYTIDYDASGIIPFERHPLETRVLENDTVFYSPLARARHTAQLLFQDRGFVLEGDSVFREFERKIIPFFNLKLPLKFYLITTKIVWFMGLNDKGIETVRCAKKRTRRNADFLEFRALRDGHAVLVAHGFHNHFVMKYLKKKGWTKIRKNGNGYLSINIMGKVED